MKKIGQSSVELLVLLSVGLVIVLMVIVMNQDTISSISSQFMAEKAKSAINGIAQASETVYMQGIGAKTRIYITLPASINKINISNNLIDIGFYSGGSLRNVYRTFSFNVSGNLSKEEGNYWVIVEAKDGYVNINNG